MSQKILLIGAAACGLFTNFNFTFAQGSLTPPGTPAPTMKSLDQIEARTPISSVPFTITNSGSYYLTTNQTVSTGSAIIIAANGVTLDLGGWTIASIAANPTGYGILINNGVNGGLSDLAIFNGHIRGGLTNNGSGQYSGPGFNVGIGYGNINPIVYPISNTRVSGVSVSGCASGGILLGYNNSLVVEACTVRTVGGYGIYASTIKNSVALDCGNQAISGDQVSDCRGQSSYNGQGINAYTANNCYGYSTSGDGIDAYTANNCYGFSTNGNGIAVNFTANNCYGISVSGSAGLSAGSAQNCYGSNSGSGYGLYATETAGNCYGFSSIGTGLYAFRSAIGCSGESSGTNGVGLYVQTGVTFASFGRNNTATGLGLQAFVATGCYGQNGSGTSETINFKYNMP